jgi:hypothetical protein
MKKYSILILISIAILALYGCSNVRNNIGSYGSAHSHMDLKVYILSKQINFNLPKYQVMEDLTHVENNDGDVIHTHATGITLGYFFDSLGFKITSDCFILDTGNKYCSLGQATLKVYLKAHNSDWEILSSPSEYILQDLDKILVTYGADSEEEIKTQKDSVTDKARYT